MNLIEVMERFPTQEICIEHLERICWGDQPYCPHCDGTKVVRRKESEIGRIGRYECRDCRATFKVTHHYVNLTVKLNLTTSKTTYCVLKWVHLQKYIALRWSATLEHPDFYRHTTPLA